MLAESYLTKYRVKKCRPLDTNGLPSIVPLSSAYLIQIDDFNQMTVLISPEELLAIDHYLGQATNNQLQGQLHYAVYSREELEFIFPSIRKLLAYGVQENEKLAKHAIRYNYAYMRRGSKDNSRHIFMLVLTYTQVLADLLSMYKQAVANEQRTKRRPLS